MRAIICHVVHCLLWVSKTCFQAFTSARATVPALRRCADNSFRELVPVGGKIHSKEARMAGIMTPIIAKTHANKDKNDFFHW